MKNFKYMAMALVFTMSMFNAQAQFDDILDKAARKVVEDLVNSDYTEDFKKLPCWTGDNDKYFVATGYFRTKVGGTGEKDFTILFNQQLNTLRQQVKNKVGGMYRSVMNDYFDQFDIDGRTSAAQHIESAGMQAVDIYLNDSKEYCRAQGDVDESGYCNYYMGLTITKEAIADAIVKGIEEGEGVPENIKREVRQNEEKFRNSALKSFSEMGQ